MAKKLTIPPDATAQVAQPWRWDIVVNTHDRDESIPEGEKRVDVVVRFRDDVIPQGKVKDAISGLTGPQKKGLKNWLFGIADLILEERAAAAGLTTEEATEDGLE